MSEGTSGHEPPDHAYAGGRSMILLHERELRRFLEIWRRSGAGADCIEADTQLEQLAG